jgi:two-component system NtrC family response regulator
MEDCEEHRGGAGSTAASGLAADPGPVRGWTGVLERARGGTLFLRGVDRLRPEGQEALLRAVREWGSEPPDGSGETGVDFRLIVGSREPLQYAVGRGAFRPDLFDRLRGVEVRVPALRERVEDVPRLVEHFVRAEAPERLPPKLGREAADRLLSYPWPGNVRELRQAVTRALATCQEEIGVADLPADIRRGTPSAGSPPGDGPGPLPPDTLELRTLERWAIRRALVVCEGNLTEAAARLGMGRTTLYRKLGAYGLR